ncbi:hypothetical protein AM587_10011823 [Phytophthora nicotianae]|uniref:Protein kinase domain-containing protein n=1 Tax=Phytophthora nicotianae TaxID=4792 RepID=A0A0W8CFM3_PHYNI|nr:hypothetical protein AM587_10011823 [Phytophthora nicotianae]
MGNASRKKKRELSFIEDTSEDDLTRIQALVEQGAYFDKRDALRSAARDGHLAVVQYLAEDCGVDVNATDSNGDTALMEAASSGKVEVVRYLANQCHADVNVKNWDGETAFTRTGSIEVVRYLAEECGVDVSATEENAKAALMNASLTGNIEIVRYLIEECGADAHATDESGRTALIQACCLGKIRVVKYLIEKCGVNVNAQDSFGHTAVMKAAGSGAIDVVRYLAEKCGADMNSRNTTGYTALMEAAMNEKTDIVRYLVEQWGADANARSNAGETALMRAITFDRIAVVRYLVKQCGADVNAPDGWGWTALMNAARFDRIDIVQYLCREGANVNLTDSLRYSALLRAIEGGNIKVIRYLVERYGADVNIANCFGDTALVVAAKCGNIDAVRYFVEDVGVNMKPTSKDECTAVFLRAARYRHKDVVQYLVEQLGVDVNATDNDGDTALLMATKWDDVGTVRYLVEQCGADVHATCKDGYTALRIATDRGYHQIVRILTPYVQQSLRVDTHTSGENTVISPLVPFIRPYEIELTFFSHDGNIGGDFRAKWLDANVVVKLFIPDSSHSAFEDEVRLWQQLRHPNVIKMYGACTVGPNLQFFVCEYATQGSLSEPTNACKQMAWMKSNGYQPARIKRPWMWKWLHEAALGLEYLHERRIIYGDLRCSNILVGNDGMAKLSNFGLSNSIKEVSSRTMGAIRWQAPEVLKGEAPSQQSDVYSLGMCILEAATGKRPWYTMPEYHIRTTKLDWIPETTEGREPGDLEGDFRALVWSMCSQDPSQRLKLSSVRYELEQLSKIDNTYLSQAEQDHTSSYGEYRGGAMNELWMKVLVLMEKCDHIQYHQDFDKLKKLRELLRGSTHNSMLFRRFETLLIQFYQMVKISPEQARIMRLSSTRATSNSEYAFQWRVKSLMASLGGTVETVETKEKRCPDQRYEQREGFISCISDTFLLLKDLKTSEERAFFLRNLKTELEDHQGEYTVDQRAVMDKVYKELTSKLQKEGGSDLVPRWFVPWYELVIDEWGKLGEGGFGSVFRAKWLDSEVVVKRVILDGSDVSFDTERSISTSYASADPSTSEAAINSTKRAEALEMFRREVDIWFGFSHPHVIQLFGACHVGRPFFVCEYATNGTLVSYLRKHPDQLWTKLYEAALGVQYLHARGVVHGDLKGNNIVIGSDLKAKVTDFGLSSFEASDVQPLVSAAWHWVAPECFPGTKAGALRVVEASKSGKGSQSCLPWTSPDLIAVKHHASQGELPSPPAMCEDTQWELIKRMCVLEPTQRIKISTVVDELVKFVNINIDNQESDTKISVVVDQQAMLANVNNGNKESDISTKVSTMQKLKLALKSAMCSHSCATEETHVSTEPNSIPSVISNAQTVLTSLQTGVNQNSDVLLLYTSLWKSLEMVQGEIDENHSDECRVAFGSLVTDASTFTMKLQNAGDRLISVAETTMRYYALDRRLDKLCEAYFIVRQDKS